MDANVIEVFMTVEKSKLELLRAYAEELGATVEVRTYFDLEYFMRSSDVGLNGIAKKICSYLDIDDLMKLRLTSKTCYKFLEQEKKFWIDLLEKGQVRWDIRRRFYLGCWENDPKRKICLAKTRNRQRQSKSN